VNTYDRTTNGSWFVQDFDGSLNFFTHTALSEQLIVHESYHGNFKDPTRFRWTKVIRAPYLGTAVASRPYGVQIGSGYPGYDMDQPTVTGGLFTELYNEAVSKFYEAVRGDTDLSVDAFQARQAVKMFRDVSKLESLVSRVRVPYAGVLKPLKLLASKHLEWKYGWKPLINSIYGTLDECAKHYAGDFSQVKRVRAVRRNSFSFAQAIGSGPAADKRTHTTSYRCELKVHYRLAEDDLDQLAGYTSLNPVSIAWELVPWSFVVDWFINVGGFLRNLESAIIYNRAFRSGYVTYSYLIWNTSHLSGTNVSGSSTDQFDLRAWCRYTGLDRQPISSMPSPYIPVRNTKPFSAERLLTGAALLSTKLKL
jgi:hypothetical protein